MLLLSTNLHLLYVLLFFETPALPGGMKEILLKCASVYDISILRLQSGYVYLFKKRSMCSESINRHHT